MRSAAQRGECVRMRHSRSILVESFAAKVRPTDCASARSPSRALRCSFREPLSPAQPARAPAAAATHLRASSGDGSRRALVDIESVLAHGQADEEKEHRNRLHGEGYLQTSAPARGKIKKSRSRAPTKGPRTHSNASPAHEKFSVWLRFPAESPRAAINNRPGKFWLVFAPNRRAQSGSTFWRRIRAKRDWLAAPPKRKRGRRPRQNGGLARRCRIGRRLAAGGSQAPPAERAIGRDRQPSHSAAFSKFRRDGEAGCARRGGGGGRVRGGELGRGEGVAAHLDPGQVHVADGGAGRPRGVRRSERARVQSGRRGRVPVRAVDARRLAWRGTRSSSITSSLG